MMEPSQMDWTRPHYPEIDFAQDELPNHPELMDELRSMGRFVPIRFHGEVACLITRYDDVKAAFLDEKTFPAAAAHREHTEPVLGPTMTTMMGREHKQNRALMSPPFRPSVIGPAMEPLLPRIARELLDEIAGKGEAELIADYTRPIAFRAITRYVGIPVEDEPTVLDWAGSLLRFAWEPEPALRAVRSLREYLMGVVQSRRHHPVDDVISMLADADLDGKPLEDREAVTAVLAVFAAGIDGPANTMASLIAAVLGDPDLEHRVRVGTGVDDGLIEEALRMFPSPAVMPRRCPEATTWRGVDFPDHARVVFGITPANRDPEAFSNPDRFDPDRTFDRSIMTFGQGLHLCLGNHLARMQMRVALQALLERFPDIHLAEGDPIERVGGVIRGPRRLPVSWTRLQ